MMLIRTRVAPSAIHGMGLFAVEAAPKGTLVWRFEKGFDREFSPEEFATLSAEAQAHLRWFAYVDSSTGRRVLSGDHTCFMNHSPTPNTGAAPCAVLPIVTSALRDVAAGEELTCDYWAFDAEAAVKLNAVRSVV
jgi:SET domain-containing protein